MTGQIAQPNLTIFNVFMTLCWFSLQLQMRGAPGPMGIAGRAGPVVSYKPVV